MQCTMCGREITNPNANYCEYCGTSVGMLAYREVQSEPPKPAESKNERVSTWVFLGIMALPMVPFVGTIAYLVFLFYWAFAPSIEDSRKSFARATLIYTAVMLVFSIAIFGMLIGTVMSGMESLIL